MTIYTPLSLCYYLQGFAEIDGAPPTEEQWKKIKEVLAKVTSLDDQLDRLPLESPPIKTMQRGDSDLRFCRSESSMNWSRIDATC